MEVCTRQAITNISIFLQIVTVLYSYTMSLCLINETSADVRLKDETASAVGCKLASSSVLIQIMKNTLIYVVNILRE